MRVMQFKSRTTSRPREPEVFIQVASVGSYSPSEGGPGRTPSKTSRSVLLSPLLLLPCNRSALHLDKVPPRGAGSTRAAFVAEEMGSPRPRSQTRRVSSFHLDPEASPEKGPTALLQILAWPPVAMESTSSGAGARQASRRFEAAVWPTIPIDWHG